MKRLIALLGVAFVLIGVRLYDNGLKRVADGKLTVYGVCEYTLDFFLPTGKDSYRIDIYGDYDMDKLLNDAQAEVVFTEQDESFIYAYSPLICRSVWLKGKRINIMLHKGNNLLNVGVPILKGSY